MHPDLILGIPFLTRFNPVINWQLCSFRVQRDKRHHWIPIVYKHDCYGIQAVAFPHDPTQQTSSGGIPLQEWEEPTAEDVQAVAKLCNAAPNDP